MRKCIVVAALVTLAWCGLLSAAPILQVDFNDLHDTWNWAPPDDPPEGWTPGGYNAWGYSPAAKQYGVSWDCLGWTQTIGSYTVACPGAPYVSGKQLSVPYWTDPNHNDFPGYGGTTTLDQMYRDGFGPCSWGGNEITLQIDGLAANTEYDVTLWGWSKYDLTTNWTDKTGGGGTSIGSIISAVAEPTSDADYSLTAKVTSDANGRIVLGAGSGNWQYVINGFQLSEQEAPVPEPGTMLLLGTGALGVFGCIRRRMLK